MNTASIQDIPAIETLDGSAIELRLLAEFEIAHVGGGEAVAVFG